MSRYLQDLLAAELGSSSLHSTGQFTIDSKLAIGKISAFQLPGRASWVVKLVQASVAAGCQELHIQLLAKSTDFRWISPPAWSLDLLEQALLDPMPTSIPGLQHFKQAIWNVVLQGRRAFALRLTDWEHALVWDGKALSRRASSTVGPAHLTVALQGTESASYWSRLTAPSGSILNAEIVQELSHRAFVCPIPLTIDARRIDALLACPGHGLTSRSYPLELSAHGAGLPAWRLPCGSLGLSYDIQNDFHRGLRLLVGKVEGLPEIVEILAIFSLHANSGLSWGVGSSESHLYWVLDGVVVARDAIDLPARSCSLGLFCSAEGLTLDYSGFALQHNHEYLRRVDLVLQSVIPFLETVQFPQFPQLTQLASQKADQVKEDLGKVFVAGILILLLHALVGEGAGPGGPGSGTGEMPEEIPESMIGRYRQDLALLQEDWVREFGA